MKLRSFFFILIGSILGSIISYGFTKHQFNEWLNHYAEGQEIKQNTQAQIQTVDYKIPNSNPINFTSASSKATPAVVHVTTTIQNSVSNNNRNDLFDYFFGNPYQHQPRESKGSGSGVIISEDGYIVTNNHVIDKSSEITVNLSDNQSYPATLIGKDKDTDLALLKIDAENLSYLQFANSDSVFVGEWVLAVGNPFNLASTVTAGIVSAKGRSINLLENVNGNTNTAIESFIQTDAAINPGNSGGALINVRGDLIGINTAIATPTGSYAGYGFAVPANIAAKVVSDLKEFGTVQRAFLGVNISDIDATKAKELGLENPKGVYVENIVSNSAADDASLQKGDVIVGINGQDIPNVATLQEKVATLRPGNVISVSFIRNKQVLDATLTLKNKFNNKELISSLEDVKNKLGIELETIHSQQLNQLNLKNGIVVANIKKGAWIDTYSDIEKGFIITKVNDQTINSPDEFYQVIQNNKGKFLIEGRYPENKGNILYALDVN